MTTSKLMNFGLHDSVLKLISNKIHEYASTSNDNSNFKSLGQYYNTDQQEGIFGTSSGIISLYLENQNNHTDLISNLRGWLLDQMERKDSISNINSQFLNNYKFIVILAALSASDEECEKTIQLVNEYINRLDLSSSGWPSRLNIPESEKKDLVYDLDLTALSVFVLRKNDTFLTNRSAKNIISVLLKKINDSISEYKQEVQLKYLLSIGILIIHDINYSYLPEPEIVEAYEKRFRKRLLAFYKKRLFFIQRSVRLFKKDIIHFDIQRVVSVIREEKYAEESKYFKVLPDVLALAALLPKNKTESPFKYISSIKVINSLSSAIYSDFKKGRLFSSNEADVNSFSTVDQVFISFSTHRLIRILSKCKRIELIRNLHMRWLPILILILFILYLTNKINWIGFSSFLLIPIISFGYEKIISWWYSRNIEGNETD